MWKMDRFSWFIVAASVAYGGMLAILKTRSRPFGSVSYRDVEDVLPSRMLEDKRKSDKPVKTGKGTKSKKSKTFKCVRATLPSDTHLHQEAILQQDRKKFGGPIQASSDVVKYVKGQEKLPQESLTALYLNSKNQVIGTALIARGTANESLVDPKDVLRAGVVSGATRFIVVHNHPSGDSTPSQADITVTKRLDKAGDYVGIQLLDHVVLGSDHSYSSLRDLGLLS